MANYIVDWQSLGLEGIPGKTSITLPQNTTNATSSSLVLTGKGLNNYGEIQQENFLRLLENFASESAPPNPTIGQLWFNADDNALMFFTMQQEWKRIGGVIEVGPDEPVSPDVGLLWLNTDEEILYLSISNNGPMSSYPRYFTNNWVQVWPHVTTYAGLQEYNLLAQQINRIIGPSTTVSGERYGWGTNLQLPVFQDNNTPTQFDNRAWTDLLQMVDAMVCQTGLTTPQRSPVGFIKDGRGTPAGWLGYGIASLRNFYDNTTALVQAIDTNRNNISAIGSETAILASHTRTTQWNTTKTHTVTITFASAAAAQSYFNSGGSFDFKFSHTPTLNNAFNISWQTFLSTQTGTSGIQFKATNLMRDSTEVGTIGYFDLTSSFQQIYNANRVGDGGYYGDNDSGLTILARVSGSGAIIEFETRLREAFGAPYGTGDVVGTTVSSVWRRNMSTACFTMASVPIPAATQGGTFISAPADAPAPPAPPVTPAPPGPTPPGPTPPGPTPPSPPVFITESLKVEVNGFGDNDAVSLEVGNVLRWKLRYDTTSNGTGSGSITWSIIKDGTTVVASGADSLQYRDNEDTSNKLFNITSPGTYVIQASMVGRTGTLTANRTVTGTAAVGFNESVNISITNITVGPGTNLQAGDSLNWFFTYSASSGTPALATATWSIVKDGTVTVANGSEQLTLISGQSSTPKSIPLNQPGSYVVNVSMVGQQGTITDTQGDINVSSGAVTESVSVGVTNVTIGPGVNLQTGQTMNWYIRYNTSTNGAGTGTATWSIVRNGSTTVANGSATLSHTDGDQENLSYALSQTGQYTINVSMVGQSGTITTTKTDINVTAGALTESLTISVSNVTIGPGVNLQTGQTMNWYFTYNTSSSVGTSGLANWTVVRNGTVNVANGSESLVRTNGTQSTTKGTLLSTAGQYTITVTMIGQNGTITQTKSDINVTVGSPVPSPTPTPAVFMQFSPNPATFGSTYTATWTSSNVSDLTLSWTGPDGGNLGMALPSLNGSVTNPTGPVGTYNFTLVGTGVNGTATDTETFTVVAGAPPPGPQPTASLVFSPNPVTYGGSYTASWTSSNVTALTLSWTGPDGGFTGMSLTVPSGSVTNPTGPAGTYNFTLVGTGPYGTVTDTETFIVNPAAPSPFTEAVYIDVNNITVGPGVNLTTGQTLNWRIRYTTSTDAGSSGLANWTLVRNGTTTVASGSTTLNHINNTLSALIENALFQTGQYTITVTMTGQGGTITRTKSDINVT